MAEHHDPSYVPREESSLENYTGTELPYKALYVSGVALFVTAVVFAVALIPMRDAFVSMADNEADGIVPSSARPAGANLQQDPEADWRVWERMMESRTAGDQAYGWQDQARTVARIPLEQAVQHALAEGLVAAAPGAPQAQLLPKHRSADTDHSGTSSEGSHDSSGDSH